jgi:hypothetical protein
MGKHSRERTVWYSALPVRVAAPVVVVVVEVNIRDTFMGRSQNSHKSQDICLVSFRFVLREWLIQRGTIDLCTSSSGDGEHM